MLARLQADHDAAIVYGPRPFVLVVLTRGVGDIKESAALIARIARLLYDEAQASPSTGVRFDSGPS